MDMPKKKRSPSSVSNISTIEKKASGSIARATDILVSLSNGGHSVTDIALGCHLSKSTVHRVLKLLEQSQMVVEDTINRRYYLGPLFKMLASNLTTAHKVLIMSARDEMKRLSNISEETVAMDIMVGIQYIPLHEISSQHDLKVTQDSKKIGPMYSGLYAGAAVKVLLSQFDDDRLKIILEHITITPATENTVTDKELLKAELKEIRQKGYCVTCGERILGVLCVAAPIKHYILPVVLSVVGPQSRLQPRMNGIITELLSSADRISGSIAAAFRQDGN
jgi:DNA-binding IclR family transcriptional regulator